MACSVSFPSESSSGSPPMESILPLLFLEDDLENRDMEEAIEFADLASDF
jgi:hypothetical protein